MALLNCNDVIELATDLYLIAGKNKARFPYCNSFLITGSETVLIDTGCGIERLKEIDEQVIIDKVIISHPHPDHMAGFNLLKDRFLMLPEETGDEVNDLVKLGTRFTGNLEFGKEWARFISNTRGLTPLRDPDGRFGHGDILDFITVRLEAIRTPGHLNDHYCFFDHSSKTLLTTDIDFTSFGPWYGNPEGAIEPFMESIRCVMELPYLRVCSSHKPPIEGDATAEFNQFLKMFKNQRRMILKLCEKPATLEDLVKLSPFYSNRFNNRLIQNIFEQNMILKNLELLIRDGLMKKTNGHYLTMK
ncbi:MAG: MBL fold metallo-hydrolase [Desulfobacterales bacterium]|nr:MBL fold metallo-hydrolase [Desulfobacterales bacterium]